MDTVWRTGFYQTGDGVRQRLCFVTSRLYRARPDARPVLRREQLSLHLEAVLQEGLKLTYLTDSSGRLLIFLP